MVDPMTSNSDVFYDKGLLYSVTINPADKHQYNGNIDRLQKFRNFMNEQLISLSEYGIRYFFTIELSEPREVKQGTTGPRLHLHGIIKFCSKKSVKYFLMNVLYSWSRFAYVDIDKCNDKDKWVGYIMKQQRIIDTQPLSSMDIDHWRQIMFSDVDIKGTKE